MPCNDTDWLCTQCQQQKLIMLNILGWGGGGGGGVKTKRIKTGAISVFSHVGSLSSNGLKMCACACAQHWHSTKLTDNK